MPVNLNQPLSWKKALAAKHVDSTAELAMLHDLQGNILKSHGRGHTANIFFSFDHNQHEAVCRFVNSIGYDVTSALQQFLTTELFKATNIDSGPFVTFLMSSKGYIALGQEPAQPTEKAFADGMGARDLMDPPKAHWDEGLDEEVHALLILAADTEDRQIDLCYAYQARVEATSDAFRILRVEKGFPQLNDDHNALEHFGYVDGRSQPLALVEDIERERDEFGGIGKWDPSIPLGQLLTPCPGGNSDVSFGSYFVFRKLEQHVKSFKKAEEKLGHDLGEIGERAGASVVGRFENGTPVLLSDDELPVTKPGNAGISNNFNYRGDSEGLKCPLASHIRKTNPRSDFLGSKSILMARRGITYGKRLDGLNDGDTDAKPDGGVGLLFMSYQSSIEGQFEITQRVWANNPQFFSPGVGIDPIIGNPQTLNPPEPPAPDPAAQRYPKVWGKELSKPMHFSGFVTMRGGEYFFAPSISFLRTMA